jgi:hypothetical protein
MDCIIFSQKSEVFTLILAANIESVLFFDYNCIAFDLNAACPKTVEALLLLMKLHHYLQQHGRYDWRLMLCFTITSVKKTLKLKIN